MGSTCKKHVRVCIEFMMLAPPLGLRWTNQKMPRWRLIYFFGLAWEKGKERAKYALKRGGGWPWLLLAWPWLARERKGDSTCSKEREREVIA